MKNIKLAYLTIITLFIVFSSSAFSKNKDDSTLDKTRKIQTTRNISFIKDTSHKLPGKIIDFDVKLNKKSYVRLIFFSESGEFMKVLEEGGMKEAKTYSYRLKMKNLSRGNYCYILEVDGEFYTRYFTVR